MRKNFKTIHKPTTFKLIMRKPLAEAICRRAALLSLQRQIHYNNCAITSSHSSSMPPPRRRISTSAEGQKKHCKIFTKVLISALVRPDHILLSETRNGVTTLTFNAPAKLNAWTGEMLTATRDALGRCETDEETRVLFFA